MSLVFLAYVAATIIIVLMAGLIVRAKKGKILIAIPVALIGIPAILVGLLFLFKEPRIQVVSATLNIWFEG
ncbi:MAG: hypothetical protein BA870_01105 [Desulfuromonadales bacterium C00003094]|jgi:hypothetical protein|nr:MAG: hypothetical protein BA870_01105 [Desulfuromonadales bacterium C00003094]